MRMYCIKKLTKESVYKDPTGQYTVLTPIIHPKLPEARDYYVPDFEYCMLAKDKNICTGFAKVKPLA